MGEIMAVNKKALNLEMLKFAGFTYTEGGWSYPDGTDVGNRVSFFPGSFDECLKWIMPKLMSRYLVNIIIDDLGCDVKICQRGTLKLITMYMDKTLPLAFCLAVKELIKGVKR